ncbi:helix-turn-helix transcriptional regulator [Paraliomyxa miuraensis]|uniref:helix-turn-helix transcriptional regulator n=1 Tax=Paraliomyxa miuraensis TaxID=376150 RepID=UPI0022556B39|nr:AraC family transcriptional regulator [Paraliomyxa miuraensis]MCX4239132.1 AraC family transcriptional regulator [Paraliomyxa miuraensis]
MLLDRLLASLRVEVAPFAVCDVRRGWRLVVPPDGHVSLHFVVQGEGRLREPDGREYPLPRGAVFVAPPGRALRVEPMGEAADELVAAADCSLPEHGWRRLVAGSGESALLMACGAIRVTYGGGVGLFDGLREPLVVEFEDDARVRVVFEGLLAEQADPAPGSQTMMRALMTQGLVAVLRRLCDSGTCSLPWMQALGDDRLVRALDAMLDAPERPHTLESVARIAGMSRSAFSERFSTTFGRTAMDLLREVRLDRGAELLRTTDLGVQEVADRVGLSSRSYFSKAFRTRFGTDPASYRAAAREDRTAAAS